MKKFFSWVALCSLLLFAAGCDFMGANGQVYITANTAYGTLITVKFIAPTDNAGSYLNQYSEYRSIVMNNGYSWYQYEVSSGTYDAYIEWSPGVGFNGRARITIDPNSSSNQWAAVYPDTGGNVWAEQGGGDFTPLLLHYP